MSLDVYLKNTNDDQSKTLYWANITHNLGAMAKASGIYVALWRPEEKGYKRAKDIIEPLEKGLKKLKKAPSHFAKHNAPNGWGVLDNFVPFVEDYLKACKEYPLAIIKVSR